ncbi:hypothetical protein G6L37_34855 [Agrobacterium rubi]|nr:hypothetical protein [Agrobacterium rubi]NTF23749.1 hypothetical protein [Agrobacterium rubi]
MSSADMIEKLAVDQVRAEIATKRAVGDFLTSEEAKGVADSVAIRECSRMGLPKDEALLLVPGMFAPIRALLIAQHIHETRTSVIQALRSLQAATGHDHREFTDDILALEQAFSADLAWKLLSHVLRQRAPMKFSGRGVPDSERMLTLREIERLSQILLMSVYEEVDLTA